MPVSTSDMLRCCIAIPARNEAERIGRCLDGLAAQTVQAMAVVLLLDRCTDATAAIAAAHPLRPTLLPRDCGNAGLARAVAMDAAAELAGPHGVVLTTDADSVTPSDWVARNLAAIRAGADLVCGRAVIDPVEALAIPPHLHRADQAECAYAEIVDALDSLIDPDPADLWPRHTEASGASLAARVAAYVRVGGMPRVRLGEDRAFAAALRRQDANIRHDPSIEVVVSGRIEGRAEGGMAATIRRRIAAPDVFLDDRLEPATAAIRRSRLRARARAWRLLGQADADPTLATDLGVSEAQMKRLLTDRFFGAAWAEVEAASPVLHRTRVAVRDLAEESRLASRALFALRARLNDTRTSAIAI